MALCRLARSLVGFHRTRAKTSHLLLVNLLRVWVRRLRQKFEPLELPCRLTSRHGQGYCLTFD